ncbi:MAG TPA: A/G-specific adenine glycosylase, partial [Candidatus Sumerlaeota bacterium]|nr:A/G-specific adenine glycosylase [Candidatus Sumerlaeota bacterium]
MARKTETDLRTLQVPLSMARDVPKRLLEWYDANKRDLPWRRMRNPYATLVSEFMLQQTQVATVVPYFERFLKEYPTVAALAQASEQDVLRQWAGLGYYSRARNLHASAKRIVSDYGGRVPDKFADLLFLPGVGRYAAGAIASIGFDVPVPAVDGNVIRVIGRLLAIAADPASPRVRQGYEQIAAQLVPQERAGDYNQSVMELGARVCTPGPGKPDCEHCPISAFCQAFAQGDPENYPPAAKRPDTVQVEEACAVVREGDLCFITRCSDNAGRYRNMWEFPGVQLGPDADAPAVLRAHLKREFGLRVRVGEEWAEIRHQVTHHRIRKRVFLCSLDKGATPDRSEEEVAQWATTDQIAALPIGAPHKKILQLLTESQDFFGGPFG